MVMVVTMKHNMAYTIKFIIFPMFAHALYAIINTVSAPKKDSRLEPLLRSTCYTAI